jgi:hypothetical protein
MQQSYLGCQISMIFILLKCNLGYLELSRVTHGTASAGGILARQGHLIHQP